MRILATDLDRTLLPNGSWPADPGAIALFNELTERHQVLVVYVTGRNLNLAESAIAEFGIRHPHVLIGDVGTSIRTYEQGGWEPLAGWDAHVMQTSPRWDAEAIRSAVAGIDGLREQEREHCSAFKQSYYVDHDGNEAVLKAVDERVKGRFDEVIVYSFDSQTGNGLLDFLPHSATKQTALEYVADQARCEEGRCRLLWRQRQRRLPAHRGIFRCPRTQCGRPTRRERQAGRRRKPRAQGLLREGRLPGTERFLCQRRHRRGVSLRCFQ